MNGANNRTDKHHMFHGRRAWTNASEYHREARQHPAFQHEGLNVQWHGILHRVVDVVPVPSEQVAQDLLQIGEDTLIYDQRVRTTHQLDIMAGYVKGHRIEESAMGMALVMGSFAAQQGIIELGQSMRMGNW